MIENKETVALDFSPDRIQKCKRELMPTYNEFVIRKMVAVVRNDTKKKKNSTPINERMSRFESVYIIVDGGDGKQHYYCHNKGEDHMVLVQFISKLKMKLTKSIRGLIFRWGSSHDEEHATRERERRGAYWRTRMQIEKHRDLFF
jgi:hypothetical protein